MRFNPPLLDLVPKEMLEKEFGGELEWEWDFEKYWAQQIACVLLYSLSFDSEYQMSIDYLIV